MPINCFACLSAASTATLINEASGTAIVCTALVTGTIENKEYNDQRDQQREPTGIAISTHSIFLLSLHLLYLMPLYDNL